VKWTDWLEALANVASILTAIIATLFFLRLRLKDRKDRLRVEAYLQKVWQEDRQSRVPLRIAADLEMSVAQVRAALTASNKIRCIPIRREGSDRTDGLAYVWGKPKTSN